MNYVVAKIKIKKYGYIQTEKTLLDEEELSCFKEVYPRREEDIVYIDVVVIEGVAYVATSSGTLISIQSVGIDVLDGIKEQNEIKKAYSVEKDSPIQRLS